MKHTLNLDAIFNNKCMYGWDRGGPFFFLFISPWSPLFQDPPTPEHLPYPTLSIMALGDSSVCAAYLEWMLNGNPIWQHSLVDVKDPMVSFAKSRQAVSGTMGKFQISALTSRGHSHTPANDAISTALCCKRTNKKTDHWNAQKHINQLLFN